MHHTVQLGLKYEIAFLSIAKEFARIESAHPNGISEQEIYELIKDFKLPFLQGSAPYENKIIID